MLKDKIDFAGCQTSVLQIILKELGIIFGKVVNRLFYIKRPEIVAFYDVDFFVKSESFGKTNHSDFCLPRRNSGE